MDYNKQRRGQSVLNASDHLFSLSPLTSSVSRPDSFPPRFHFLSLHSCPTHVAVVVLYNDCQDLNLALTTAAHYFK